jgi:hypothetical protein
VSPPSRFALRFDEATWNLDLEAAGRAGREVALTTRGRYERLGLPVKELRPCERHARDGTDLSNCVKTYAPSPAGRFGFVFRLEIINKAPTLTCLAFGVRHHPRNSHAATVYEIAHARLHPDE